MRTTSPLLSLNKALRSTIKQRLRQNILRTKTGDMGWHTKHGRYVVDYNKVRSYVVPEGLDQFPLTPFVSKKILPEPGINTKKVKGKYYLKTWKEENGVD